jgi:betaine-aldehyde dehydrogenase
MSATQLRTKLQTATRIARQWIDGQWRGLAASIWSRDVDRPLRSAREIQAGTVQGGYKQSGRGRLRGLATLEDFVEYKHIVLQPGVAAR